MVKVYERALKGKKIGFYLHYKINGKRIRENLNLGVFQRGTPEYLKARSVAEVLKGRRIEQMLSGSKDIKIRSEKAIGLLQYFEKYRASYKGKDYRKLDSLIENYVRGFFKNDTSLSDLSELHCKRFLKKLKADLKAETVKNYFGLFRRVLQEALDEDQIVKNPSARIKLQLPTQDRIAKDVLTISELRILSQTPCGNEEVKRAFLFACNTGITKAELEVLKWKDIHGDKLRYYRFKTSQNIEVNVHLNANALKLLGERGELHRLVFKRLPSSNGTNKCIRYWVKRAGITKHITFYCARHTFGTLQAEMGANQKVIAQNMGHTSSKYTDKYVNYVDEARKLAINFPSI